MPLIDHRTAHKQKQNVTHSNQSSIRKCVSFCLFTVISGKQSEHYEADNLEERKDIYKHQK